MSLGEIDKEILEKLFDYAITNVRTNVKTARNGIFRNILNDKDGVDLALGLTLGILHMSFMDGFQSRHNRIPNSDENEELLTITGSKLKDLKEAIFKCG